MKKIWVNVRDAFLFAVLCLGVPLVAKDWSPVLVDMDKSVPVLVSEDARGKGNCATTVFNEREDFVLTAGHCVEKKEAITVGSRHAEVVVVNGLLDLAILKTKGGSKDIPLAKTEALVGSEVAVLGYPFAEMDVPVPTFGNVSRRSKKGEMWLNVAVQYGQSGGPVINSQGELVGIVSAIRGNSTATLGVIVPLEHVRDFIEDYLYPAKKK